MISILDEEGINRKVHNLVKWAGGKGSLMKEIIEKVPKEFNNYYEPFFGGELVKQ